MPTNDEKAAARVEAAIKQDVTLHAWNALDREDTSVGPYHEAVDRGMQYAVFGKSRRDVFNTADGAAWCFVRRVGSTRAREAALKAAPRARRRR